MCRARSEETQREKLRCDCDTNETRRLRHHTRDALDRHAESAYQPIDPIHLPFPTMEEPFTVESIKADINSTDSTIKELKAQGVDTDTICIFVDERVNRIGAGVEYLSENKYGAPTDQELQDAYDSFEKPYRELEAAALAAGRTDEEADQYAAETVDAEYSQTMSQLFKKRNIAIKNALTDVGVIFAQPESLRCSKKSNPEAVAVLKKAVTFYPQNWVNNSNFNKYPLHVEPVEVGERPGYQHVAKLGMFNRKSIITVSEDRDFGGGLSVGIHEFAHRIEYTVPGVTNLEQIFVMRRTGHFSENGNQITPEELTPILEVSSETNEEEDQEVGFKDNFPTHYMGKVYDNGTWEVLAMGMETLFSGTNGGFAGIENFKEDSDYKKFIIGTLASSAKD